jgi:Domain of unknown function (DUF4262)
MCWSCDHPDATHEDFLAMMRDNINTYGWAVQGVERDGDHPPWAYTAGLTEHGRPELVITGMSLGRGSCLLNDVAAHLLHAPAPRPGEQFQWPDEPLLEVVRVAEPTAHLTLAVELCGPRIRALQLVHADDHGQWPWDRGYRGGRGGQPVLGPRAPQDQRRLIA